MGEHLKVYLWAYTEKFKAYALLDVGSNVIVESRSAILWEFVKDSTVSSDSFFLT